MAEIVLKQVYPTGTVRLDGGVLVNLEPGANVLLKTRKSGVVETILDAEVPHGKKWSLSINVSVVESDE